MAAGYTMKKPICLVENQKSQLRVSPEALQLLDKITQPVVVVAIAGLYRTGKSYLMNRLAGQNDGFPLGSTVQSETKGIWMWCVPHPSKPKHALILLDTEGLGDVEKGDPKNDTWIFTLAVLLSSTFIYNSMGTINHQALEQLHYVSELTKLIWKKSFLSPGEGDDSAEFMSFFPDFVWTVRDFMLELKKNRCSITEDEYLQDALKLIPEKDPEAQKSNMSRLCIKKFFPRQKCFVFDRPTNDKTLLCHMEKVSENQLDKSFQEKSKIFCNYIFTHTKAKTIREETSVTGNGLGILAKAYVDVINSGAVPCLENAVTTLAERENPAAVQKAANHYSEQMNQRVRFPTGTLQELLDVHAACEREAIAIFVELSFSDDNWEFQRKLLEHIEKRKEDFLLQNEDASVKYCQAQLQQLTQPLMESITRTSFVPGGYNRYLEAMDKVIQSYNQVPRKGVKANETLENFLQTQAAIKEFILQADQSLTAADKALAAKNAKNQQFQAEQNLLKQKLKEQQEKMQAQEKSFKEHIAQLRNKTERVHENQLKEKERMLEEKQKLLKEVQSVGLEAETKKLKEDINQLKEQIKERKKNWNPLVKGIVIGAASALLAATPLLLGTGMTVGGVLFFFGSALL